MSPEQFEGGYITSKSVHAHTQDRSTCPHAHTNACTPARSSAEPACMHTRTRSDCFSFGNLIWRLYTGKTPWGGIEGYVIGPKVRAREHTGMYTACATPMQACVHV